MPRLDARKAMTTIGRAALREEWMQLAPAWIRESREGANPAREGLLDGSMLEACGNANGLTVLDCGCGEGRFCRMLLDRGAERVLGIDLCPPMVMAATQLATGRDAYLLADVQEMGFLRDNTFDLAVSYLNQCDLPDFEANTAGIHLSERISQLSERMSQPYYGELSGRFGVKRLHAPGVPRSRSRGLVDWLGTGDLLCTGCANKTDPTWYGRRSKTQEG